MRTMPDSVRPGRRFVVALVALLAAAASVRAERPQDTGDKERSFLYVAVPGIRNYVEFGGIGLVVFDRDDGYKFVKRIPTWPVLSGEQPENVKGIAASARDGRVYITTIKRIAAFDVVTETKVWESTPEGGCDRMAISPDGRLLYVPSFEGPNWNVLEAATGKTVARLDPNSRAHNTLYGLDGRAVYLEDPDFRVRIAATNALKTLKDDSQVPALEKMAARELDGRGVRMARENALALRKGAATDEEVRKLREEFEKFRDENAKLRDRLEKLEVTRQ